MLVASLAEAFSRNVQYRQFLTGVSNSRLTGQSRGFGTFESKMKCIPPPRIISQGGRKRVCRRITK